jgi:hypothetical protein
MGINISTNIVVGVFVEKLALSEEILEWFMEGEMLFPIEHFGHPVIGICINDDCYAPINGNMNCLFQLPRNTEQIIAEKKLEFIKLVKESIEEYPIEIPVKFWTYIESAEFSIFVDSSFS